MRVVLERVYNCATYCIGHLYVDGKFVCDTIEDTDRGLSQTMTDVEIKKRKVYAQTAIPVGVYPVTLSIVSPKFSKKPYYQQFCYGKVPRVLNVPGFDGILMHMGRTERNSAGCLIVGYNTIKGQVTNTQQAFEKLYKILASAKDAIKIEVKRKFKVS